MDNISYFVSNIALDLMRPLQQCPEVDHDKQEKEAKAHQTPYYFVTKTGFHVKKVCSMGALLPFESKADRSMNWFHM